MPQLPKLPWVVVPSTITVMVTIGWDYPTNCVTPDLGFILFQGANLGQPLSNWTMITNVLASNCVSTNLDATGTNNVFALNLWVVPAQYFWVVETSNFWGNYGYLGLPSNVITTPPAPGTVTSNSISRK